MKNSLNAGLTQVYTDLTSGIMIQNSSLAQKSIIFVLSTCSALNCIVLGAEARPKTQFQPQFTQKISHPTKSRPGGYSVKLGQSDTTGDCECDNTSNNARSMELTQQAWKLRKSNVKKAVVLLQQALQIDAQNQYAWIAVAYIFRESEEGKGYLQIAAAICQEKGDAEGLEVIEQFVGEYYS
jgi:hypothetical protein